MSAGRCDSSPDSRSMPTVDLQWWLSSTDVFYTTEWHPEWFSRQLTAVLLMLTQAPDTVSLKSEARKPVSCIRDETEFPPSCAGSNLTAHESKPPDPPAVIPSLTPFPSDHLNHAHFWRAFTQNEPLKPDHNTLWQAGRDVHSTRTHVSTHTYLVEGCQVVSGLYQEGLVDPRMVHIVGGGCHQTQEHIQRTQLLCQLQHAQVEKVVSFIGRTLVHIWLEHSNILQLPLQCCYH